MANGILKVGEITTSSGSGNITIGSGVTLNSNTPAFRLRLSANQSIPSSTYTKLALDTEVWDTDDAWDTTNYRFTTPTGAAGKYQFSYKIFYDDLDDGEFGAVRFSKNGTELTETYNQIFSPKSVGNMMLSGTETVSLVAGDYLELFVKHDESSAINIREAFSFFEGIRIGA